MSRMRTLAGEPQAVWDVLADFGLLSSWARNVDHSCLLEHGDGGVGIGTSRRVQMGHNTLVERITELEQLLRTAHADIAAANKANAALTAQAEELTEQLEAVRILNQQLIRQSNSLETNEAHSV